MKSLGSIFAPRRRVVEAPTIEAPVMRALEPRVLLDAAAAETFADAFDTADVALPETTDAAPTEPAPDLSRDIVFVDAGVDDLGTLLEALDPSVEVHVLQASSDGVSQIADILAGRSDIAAVHIFAHGGEGTLALGNVTLDRAGVTGVYADDLAAIGASLGENGDILIYGCSFGADRATAEALAQATGADIAASDDLTGSAQLGGDWDLEVTVGTIDATAFSAPNWNNLLAAFEIQATSDPIVRGGNSVGATALWENAGSVGAQAIDIRATVTAVTGGATAGFETVSLDDSTRDDMRVIVTNGGSVTIVWEIFLAGTTTRPDEGKVSLTIADIDGNGGPQTIEGLSANLAGLSSYTTQSPTNLEVVNTGTEIFASGTENSADGSVQEAWVQYSWGSVNQLELTYHTYQNGGRFFEHDGDGDLVFTNPNTNFASGIDLDADDSSGATGSSYQDVIFVDPGVPGDPNQPGAPGSPVAVADGDIEITNGGGQTSQAVITLLDPFDGDALTVDNALLASLGLAADPADTSVPGQITLTITGVASTIDYHTAIQAVEFSTDRFTTFDADSGPRSTDLDRTPRSINIQVFDGAFASGTANTAVTFASVVNRPTTARDVYVGTEDTVLVADGTSRPSLLANDSDPQGDPLVVSRVIDATGASILVPSLGTVSVALRNGTLEIAADGTFTYTPAAHFSGVDAFSYFASDGSDESGNYAAINIRGVADTPTSAPTDPGVSDEDQPTGTVSLTPSSADTDGSEKFRVHLTNVPVGVTITDGVRQFRSTGPTENYFLDGWRLDTIRALPVANSDEDFTVDVVTVSIEPNGNRSAPETEQVTFVVRAVADVPDLLVTATSGTPNTSIALAPLVAATPTDTDGSEVIVTYTFTDLTGGTLELNGVTLAPTTTGPDTWVVSADDLIDLAIRAPGTNGAYSVDVMATVEESANGAQVATKTANSDLQTLDFDIFFGLPVSAIDDSFTVARGVPASFDPLVNDASPDGGPAVVSIDGQAIAPGGQVVLANGAGTVTMSAAGELSIVTAPGAPEAFSVSYEMRDADNDRGAATITFQLGPQWSIAGVSSVVEGAVARYLVDLTGDVSGAPISIDLALVDDTTDPADREAIADALAAAVAGHPDFSVSGTTLTYEGVTADPRRYGEATRTGIAYTDITADPNVVNLNVSLFEQDAVALPFDFEFYGVTYSDVHVSDFGVLTFGGPPESDAGAYSNTSFAAGTTLDNRPAIAPFWDVLGAGDRNNSDDVYTLVTGTPGSREFVVQYSDVVIYFNDQPGETIDFQVVLREGTNEIELRYDDVDLTNATYDRGASATVGLSDGTGARWNEFSFNTASLQSGMAITYTPFTPSLLLEIDAFQDALNEADENFSINLANPSAGVQVGQSSVTTTIVEDLPLAIDDAVIVANEDGGAVLFDPIANDVDLEGAGLTVTQIAGQAIAPGGTVTVPEGIVSMDGDGALTFTPNPDFNGLVAFTYEITDASGDTATAVSRFDIQAMNDDPTLFTPTVPNIAEDTVLVLSGATAIQVNDVDPDALTVVISVAQGTLTVATGSGATATGNGSASVVLTGTQAQVNAALDGLVYAPVADFNGSDSIAISVDDGTTTVTGSVALTIDPVADGVDDYRVVTGTVALIDVLENDTFEGANPTVSATDGARGTVSILPDGRIEYTWGDAAIAGIDSFDYTVTSGGVSETRTVFVVRHAEPTTVADAQSTDEDTVVTGLVLPNDLATGVGVSADYTTVTGTTWTTGVGADLTWIAGVSVNSAPASALPGITQALVLDGTGGATGPSLETLAGDPSDDPATIETWFRYDPATLVRAGQPNSALVYETGGSTDGFSIGLTDASGLTSGTGAIDHLRVELSHGSVDEVLLVDLEAIVGAGNIASEFLQVAVSIDPTAGSETVSVFVNGVLAETRSVAGQNDWSGGSGAALGTTSNGPNANGYGSFIGEVAKLTLHDGALDADGVRNSFDAVAGFMVTAQTFTTASGAAVSVSTDGTYSYDPTGSAAIQALGAGQSLFDTFTYEVTDSFGQSVTETVTVTVAGVNDAPNGTDATIAVTEDQPRALVRADFGFSDPVDEPDDEFMSVLVDVPSNGTLTLAGTVVSATTEVTTAQLDAGDLVYVPAANAFGSAYATLLFRVRDDAGGADTDPSANTLTIDVAPVNDAPVLDLEDDGTTTDRDMATAYTENDGTVSLVAGDATILDVDSATMSSATITLSGFADPSEETVLIGGASFAVGIDAAQTVTVGATTFELALVGSTVTITETAGATVPVADLNGLLRTLSYVHAGEDPTAGTRTLAVTVNDGTLDSNTARATVAVTPVNDVPDLVVDTRNTEQNTPVVVDVLANDSDRDDGIDPVTVMLEDPNAPGTFASSVTIADEGQYSVSSAGSVLFVPDAGFTGTGTTLTYRVADRSGDTATATLTVTVATPNLVDDVDATDEDVALTIDLLGNDTQTGNVIPSIIDQPANGTVSVNADGTVVYTPDPDFNGTDTFNYTVTAPSDLFAGADARFVPFNDFADIDVLANDGFSGSAAVAITAQPLNGTATVNPDGTVRYVPNTGYEGPDSFTYLLTDDTGSTGATVAIDVLRDPNTEHWIAPTILGHSQFNNPIELVLNTSSTDPVDVLIEFPGTSLPPIARTITVFDGDATVSIVDQITTDPADLGAIAASGIKVTATDGVRVDVKQDGGNAQSFLSTKGLNALGTEFYAGAVNSEGAFDNDGDGVQFVSVMATRDNTTVTIERPVGSSIVWADDPDSNVDVSVDANETITVTLNAGETFAVRATSGAADTTGTHITSDKPITASSGSQDYRSNGAGENAWDQLVPSNLVGRDYVIRTADSPSELVKVVALEDGTDIFLDGVLQTTIDAGEVWINDFVDGAQDNTAFALETSKDTYVFQVSGTVDDRDENGISHIPPLDKDGIAETRFLTPSTGGDFYVVTASSAAPTLQIFEVDPATDTMTLFTPAGGVGSEVVSGNADFSLLSFNLPADRNFLIRSDAQVQIGMLAASGSGGGFGYLSGFDQSRLAATDDSVVAIEGRSVDILPLANDQTTTRTNLSVSSIGLAANGTVTDLGNGRLQYMPNTGFTGLDSFTYSVIDEKGNAATATVEIDVRGRPIATVTVTVQPTPDPALDEVSVAEGQSVTFDPLANDPSDDGTVSATIDALPPVAEGTLTHSGGTAVVAGAALTPGELATLTFTAAGDFNGTLAPIAYTVTDASGDTASASIAITVTPVADDPRLSVPAAQTVDEDGELLFPGNITVDEVDGDEPLTVTLTAAGTLTVAAGTGATIVSNGGSFVEFTGTLAEVNAALATLVYRAGDDVNGTDTVTVTTEDASTATVTATIDVSITAVADATDDDVTTVEDTPVTFNVITDDLGAGADTFAPGNATLVSTTEPLNGSLTIDADGTITFTPDANWSGTTTFSYVVEAGGTTETATVTVTVDPVNDRPTIVAQVAQNVTEDTVSTLAAIVVDDADGTVLTVDLGVGQGTLTITDAGGASVQANGTGAVRIVGTKAELDVALGNVDYLARPDYHGADVLTVTADDLSGTANATATATISLAVGSVADAFNDQVDALEDGSVTFDPLAANGGAADTFSDPSAFVHAVGTPAQGSASIVAGQVVYQPDANATGTDSFTYTVRTALDSGTFLEETATVVVTITPVNDAPTSGSGAIAATEDQTVTFAASDFPFTDTVENDALQAVVITSLPADGTLHLGGTVLAGAGPFTVPAAQIAQLTFEPAPNFNGTTTFQFQVRDDGGTLNGGVDTSATQTFTLDFAPAPDAPVAVADMLTLAEDAIATIAVLGNDSDPDGEAVSVVSFLVDGVSYAAGTTATLPSGSVTISSAGAFVFAPAANFNGPIPQVTYTIRDAGSASSTATATVDVTYTAVADAPEGADNTITVLEEGSHTFAAADFGFTDPDGDSLAFVRIDTLPAGTLAVNGTPVTAGQRIAVGELANLVWSPAANANGAALTTLDFTVIDDSGSPDDTALASSTLTFDVTAVSDAPVGGLTTVQVLEDGSRAFTVADFAFADAADGPNPDTFAGIVLDTLPVDGTLLYAGAATASGQFIAAADLGDLIYTPLADQNGSGYATFTAFVRDTGSTADGGAITATSASVVTIDVLPVSDAPAGTDATITMDEDGSHTFAPADFGFSDGEGDTFQSVVVTTLPTSGTLELNGTAVAPDDVVLVTDIPNLVFKPTANENGVGYATIGFAVRDSGSTANGGIVEDASPNTLTIDVNPVSDRPTGADRTITVLEDGTHTFDPSEFGFADALDGDDFAGIFVDTLPAEGQLTLDNVPVTAGTFVPFADLGRLIFAPAADGFADVSFEFRVRDDGAGDDTDAQADTIAFAITPVSDAPTGGATTVEVLEDGTRTFTAADFLFADANDDPDPDVFAGVVIGALPADGTLLFQNVPVTSGTFVAAADLTDLVYAPAANQNGAGYASFSVFVRDTGSDANGGETTATVASFVTIDVLPVSDAPTGTDGTISIQEDGSYAFEAADFGFADPEDGDTLSSVEITALPDAGTLELNGTAVTVNDVIDAADLSGLVFTPAANANGIPYAMIGFAVRDTGSPANGGSVEDATPNVLTIEVAPVSDAPTGADRTVVLAEDGSHTFEASQFGFIDPADNDAFAGVLIDTLPAAGILRLGTVAVVAGDFIPAADLGDLVFTPAPDGNGVGYATFDFRVRDDAATNNTDLTARTITFDVVSAADAPSGADKTVSVDEDAFYTFAGADFGFSDIGDGDAFTGITVVTLPLAGTLAANGMDVAAGDFVNAADLAGLRFTPAPNENGAGYASFEFRVRDNGADSNDAIDVNTITIDVTAVADAPEGADSTITILEDGSHAFVAADFGFSDADGDDLAFVRIDTLPTGRLELNGTQVAAGQRIAAADIANLVWSPAADSNGSSLSTIEFSVIDDSGAAVDVSAASNTLTLDVTPVSDAPEGADRTVQVDEDGSLPFTAADFGFSDDADGDDFAGIAVTALGGGGTLEIDGIAVQVNDFVKASDISRLLFTPGANENGAGYATIGFAVRDTGSTANGGSTQDATPNTLTIDVASVSDAPTGTDATIVITEDGAHTFSAADFGFADPDDTPEDAFSGVTIITAPVNGTLSLGGQPVLAGSFVPVASLSSLVFTPGAEENGAAYATLDFTVRDTGSAAGGGETESTPNTLVFDVTAINDAPTANDDQESTAQDTRLDGNVLLNDTDPDAGDALEVKAFTIDGAAGTLGVATNLPGMGEFTLRADGSYTFEPAPGFEGALPAIVYTMDDGGPASDTATLSVFVTSSNDAPVAVDDTFVAVEGTTVTGNVIDNDTDADLQFGDVLSVTSFEVAGLGSYLAGDTAVIDGAGELTILADGTLTFVPEPEFNGFAPNVDYQLADSAYAADTGSISIEMTAVNDAPVAVDDTFATDEDQTSAPIDLLGNDIDPDGPALSLASIAGTAIAPGDAASVAVAGGTVDVDAAGVVTFTPDADFNGTTTFSYVVTDGTSSATGTVNGEVRAVQDAPVVTAPADQLTDEDTDLVFSLANSNAIMVADADGEQVTVTVSASLGVFVPSASNAAVSGSGTSSIVISGLPADVNAALEGLVYAPFADVFGSDAISISVGDGKDDTVATIPVTIAAVDDATNDAVTTDEDTAVSFNVLTGTNGATPDAFSDPNAALVFVSQPMNGTVGYTPDGVVTFTPAADWSGTETLSYTVNAGGSDETATIVVTVLPVDDVPAVQPDTFTVPEDGTVTIDVLFNDSDPDGTPLTITEVDGVAISEGESVSVPTGTVTLSAGKLVFVPSPDTNGPASFAYTVSDGTSSNTGRVSGTITSVNDAPMGTDTTIVVVEDEPKAFTAADFGFSDPDGDTFASVVLTTLPNTGTLTLNGIEVLAGDEISVSDLNRLVYAAPRDAFGPAFAELTFQVRDDGGTANGGVDLDGTANTIVFDVAPVNDAPVAVVDLVSTNEDESVLIDVVRNDLDPDGPGLQPIAVNGVPIAPDGSVSVADGTVVRATGGLLFIPAAGFFGTATFDYTVSDGEFEDTASVSVDVRSVNDAPQGADATISVAEDATHIFDVVDFGFSDTDGDAFAAVTIDTPPTTGSLKLSGTAVVPGQSIPVARIGELTFEPLANANGSEPVQIMFSVVDDGGTPNGGIDTDTTPNRIVFDVLPVNEDPTAEPDTFATPSDVSVTIDPAAGSSDPDGDALSVTKINGEPLVEGGSGVMVPLGTVTLSGGEIVFTPSGASGSTSFTFTVSDGNGGTATNTVMGTITAVNQEPVLKDDTLTVTEDVVANGNVLDNDDTTDGPRLEVTQYVVAGVTVAAGTPVAIAGVGTVSLLADGTFAFQPDPEFSGTVPPITYTASDGALSDEAVLSITVTPVDDVPLGTDDTFEASEDEFATGNVLANDTDPEGAALVVTSVFAEGQPAVAAGEPLTIDGIGTLLLQSDGTFAFQPEPDWNGTVPTITYHGSDGVNVYTATLGITILPVDDAPVAINDTFTAAVDTPIRLRVLLNDGDADGDALTITHVDGHPITEDGVPVAVTNGSVTLVGDELDFVPASGFTGSVSFDYTVSDGTTAVDASVSGTVVAGNVAPTGTVQPISVPEDASVTGTIDTFDANGDPVAVTLVTSPVNGTVSVLPDGTFNYTPDPDTNGPDRFTVELDDGQGGTTLMDVPVDIVPVNDAPVVVVAPPTIAVPQGSPIEPFDLVPFFADIDGPLLTYSASGLPDGLLLDPATGLVSGTVDPNVPFGPAAATITVTDGTDAVSVEWTIEVIDPTVTLAPVRVVATVGSPLLFDIPGLPDGATIASVPVLPTWLRFDPEELLLAGDPPADALGSLPPIVFEFRGTIGPIIASLEIVVVSDDPIVGTLPNVVEGTEPTLAKRLKAVDPFLVEAVERVGDLSRIGSLSGANGFIVEAVERMNDLQPTASADEVDPFLLQALDAINGLREMHEEMRAHDTSGAGPALESDVAPSSAEASRKTDVGRFATRGSLAVPNVDLEADAAMRPAGTLTFDYRENSLAGSEAPASSARIVIETYLRGTTVFLDVSDTFDPIVEGRVRFYRLLDPETGADLMDAREVRHGFFAMERGEARMARVTVAAVFEDGRTITRDAVLDLATGSIVPTGEAGQPVTFLGQVKASYSPF